jgi:DNA-binding SARP family transcriptional activator
VEKEKRTGLNLTPDKPFSFQDGFTLSFDIKFNSDWLHPFGSIFRIVTEERQHIDLILSEIGNTGKTMLSFISSSNDMLFNQPFDGHEIDYDHFIPVSITVDFRGRTTKASVGGKQFARQTSSLDGFRHSHIIFGKSNYPRFQTTDVPSFVLKDLRIENLEGKLLYDWPLSRHVEKGVYDNVTSHFAFCENPSWVLDNHAIWQKQTAFETRLNPQLCYNPDQNEIAVYDQDFFFRFNLKSNTLTKKEVKNKLVYATYNSNNLIYNPYTKEYNCYWFLLSEGVEVIRYDTAAGNWEKSNHADVPTDYWHHNRFFSPLDSNLYLMDGYGHHKYKNIINRYDYQTKKWEKLSLQGDKIQPRYLSGLGKADERHFLLFGGYGSETGNQEMLPQCYYDLFMINIQTLESQKLWEMESPAVDFVAGNSIIVSEDGQSFYALTFPNQQEHSELSLLKFSTLKPGYSVVAESIPFRFEDVKSYADLYLDKSAGRLVAVVVVPQAEATSSISVYTLAYPPLTTGELYQEEKKTGLPGIVLLAAGALALLSVVCYLLLRAKKQTGVQHAAAKEETDEAANLMPANKQAVCLFGGFQVFDKDGADITKEFTPMLRQLFVLLLLYTAKNGKGISSARLKDLLWADKSEESAKNNRGVFINKLRQLFEHIGPLQIKNYDMYWRLEMEEPLYCDYTNVLSLMQQLSASKTASMEEVKMLLAVVAKGELLPNMQMEWVDAFKADFSNKLIDLLLDLYRQSGPIRKSFQLCLRLADVIFIHDSLNEDALSIKCRHLVNMGKYGLARKVYTTFVKEYKALFNADFGYSFEQVIQNTIHL